MLRSSQSAATVNAGQNPTGSHMKISLTNQSSQLSSDDQILSSQVETGYSSMNSCDRPRDASRVDKPKLLIFSRSQRKWPEFQAVWCSCAFTELCTKEDRAWVKVSNLKSMLEISKSNLGQLTTSWWAYVEQAGCYLFWYSHHCQSCMWGSQ